ncbi:hypothetical protein JTB14_001626 [Gonioctena quinquepunctata]|nr:hypothetical protein JTB14_001626 [Gonioctena quinquepunctata]
MGFLDKHVPPRRTFGNVKRVNAADDQPSSSQWDTFNEMIEAPQSEEGSEPMEENEDSIEESPDKEEPQGPQETTALKENLNPRLKATKKTPEHGISKKKENHYMIREIPSIKHLRRL